MAAKEKVLIVEDEKDIAELMMLHLKREGCEVDVVENGEEALEKIRKHTLAVFGEICVSRSESSGAGIN